mmetsp:Transcript_58316/g.102564  ORF Transcript_58316/g.102564 Transcript_58316/m.102564 type:complete len:259 (-) Transcript_58316:785-1561(-)
MNIKAVDELHGDVRVTLAHPIRLAEQRRILAENVLPCFGGDEQRTTHCNYHLFGVIVFHCMLQALSEAVSAGDADSPILLFHISFLGLYVVYRGVQNVGTDLGHALQQFRFGMRPKVLRLNHQHLVCVHKQPVYHVCEAFVVSRAKEHHDALSLVGGAQTFQKPLHTVSVVAAIEHYGVACVLQALHAAGPVELLPSTRFHVEVLEHSTRETGVLHLHFCGAMHSLSHQILPAHWNDVQCCILKQTFFAKDVQYCWYL